MPDYLLMSTPPRVKLILSLFIHYFSVSFSQDLDYVYYTIFKHTRQCFFYIFAVFRVRSRRKRMSIQNIIWFYAGFGYNVTILR